MTRLLAVHPDNPEPAVLEEAVMVLRQGGVVAYPTDTVYGLAVDVLQHEAIAHLYAVKGRPSTKALPVIIGDLAQLSQVALPPSAMAERLMARFWPGPLTLLFLPHPAIPPLLLGNSTAIGVRWPASRLSQGLAQGLGGAITASSANRSGAAAALSAMEVARQLAVDLILDGGTVTSAEVSTVLDLYSDPPRILRPGKIPQEILETVLGRPLEVCFTP